MRMSSYFFSLSLCFCQHLLTVLEMMLNYLSCHPLFFMCCFYFFHFLLFSSWFRLRRAVVFNRLIYPNVNFIVCIPAKQKISRLTLYCSECHFPSKCRRNRIKYSYSCVYACSIYVVSCMCLWYACDQSCWRCIFAPTKLSSCFSSWRIIISQNRMKKKLLYCSV